MAELTICALAFVGAVASGLGAGLPFFAVRKAFVLVKDASSFETRD